MKTYQVTWSIELSAKNEIEAAKQALEIQRDSESEAVVFDVTEDKTTNTKQIDLLNL